jgi:hypothetical protein
MDWILRNPHVAVAAITGTAAIALFVVRFGLTRHREFVVFTRHMQREEDEVWPETITSIHALDAKLAGYHEEAMRQLAHHGERIARVEARMPNGELEVIKRMLGQLLVRKAEGD